jgi:hypothetical protein
MGINVNDILATDPQELQRQRYMQQMQQASQVDPIGQIGFMLGRGISNKMNDRSFFDTTDPALQRVAKIKQIQTGIAQSGETDPLKATAMLADALSQDPELAPLALNVRSQLTELQNKQREQSLRERTIAVQEGQLTESQYKNNPELLLAEAEKLEDTDPKKQSLLNRYNQFKRSQDIELQKQQLELATWTAKANAARQEAQSTKPKVFTPAQRTADTTFAKEYSAYVSGGGFSTVQKNLNDLDKAIKILETNKDATGKLVGAVNALGDTALAAAYPKAAEAKDLVGGVAQSNLRAILGGQFAAKEGEALLARAYNPGAPTVDNLRRLRSLREQIIASAKAKEAAGTHFEKEGTLVGFKGIPFATIQDIPQEKPKSSNAPAGTWRIVK